MSGFGWIERYYGVRYKRGQLVKMDGKLGRITCAKDGYVRVLFDGGKRSLPCHPTWRMEVRHA